MRSLAPLLMAACAGFAMTAQAAPATTEAKLVAALTALPAADRAIASGRGAALLHENFAGDDNSCNPPGNAALSFDQLCQWSAPGGSDDDAEAWPDLFVGLSGGHIVSLALSDDKDAVGPDWSCKPMSDPTGIRFCFPSDVPAAQQARWTQEWTTFLNAAN